MSWLLQNFHPIQRVWLEHRKYGESELAYSMWMMNIYMKQFPKTAWRLYNVETEDVLMGDVLFPGIQQA